MFVDGVFPRFFRLGSTQSSAPLEVQPAEAAYQSASLTLNAKPGGNGFYWTYST